ncbi:cytochrome c oxidase assembly factor 1 homolog [Cynocephalus volans]|uniref:cytochrome c oxidase assembly factor 1 homolog n=1 Tax=Cynocephalus volans TaxID=110931 RepID=UPI002FCB9A73
MDIPGGDSDRVTQPPLWSNLALCSDSPSPLRAGGGQQAPLGETFSRALYYQMALEQLQSHPKALEAPGSPLNVHYLQLTDKHSFVDIADAQLRIPVSGSRSEGHLYVSSSRDAPFQRWHLQEVFLELKGGQQMRLFKLREQNGDEVEKEER